MYEDKILIVDDDESVLSALDKIMTANGFEVETESSGIAALDLIFSRSYSLILLDVNLADSNGFTILDRIRQQGVSTPVMIVSGRKEDSDTLIGLDLGADDYITKPFNPVILTAKAKALIRRASNSVGGGNDMISVGSFSFDSASMRLYRKGVEIPLSPKEIAIMRLFMDNANHVVSKSALLKTAWDEGVGDDAALKVYISKLRAKIEDDPSEPEHILTVRGFGYRFIA